MSLTLGEKLRQAREERGITLSEVAEQTRISSLYLESIEHDDYRNLPGGIFNKGFVKSFAKYVGVDEQEALLDYSHIVAANEGIGDPELKLYKPEVLTDDRSGSSMIPTVIIAVVILALMTGGILWLISYLRQPAAPPVANKTAPANTTSANEAPVNTSTASTNAPDMATLKVEFKALTQAVSLTATNDGSISSNVVTAGSTSTFEPKESLKLSYSRSLASAVQLTINGKTISLPAVPLNPKRNAIEFEINKDNLGQIWSSGAISGDVPAAVTDANANISNASSTNPPGKTTPAAKPTVSANTPANTAGKLPVNPKPTNTQPPTMMTTKPKATPKPQ